MRVPEGSRTNRVSEEFREILAEEIPRLKDPRVGFVTVLGVTVTPDLRLARVFYTTLGDDRAHRAPTWRRIIVGRWRATAPRSRRGGQPDEGREAEADGWASGCTHRVRSWMRLGG